MDEQLRTEIRKEIQSYLTEKKEKEKEQQSVLEEKEIKTIGIALAIGPVITAFLLSITTTNIPIYFAIFSLFQIVSIISIYLIIKRKLQTDNKRLFLLIPATVSLLGTLLPTYLFC